MHVPAANSIFTTTHHSFSTTANKKCFTELCHMAYRQPVSLAFLQHACIVAEFLNLIKFQFFGIQLLF